MTTDKASQDLTKLPLFTLSCSLQNAVTIPRRDRMSTKICPEHQLRKFSGLSARHPLVRDTVPPQNTTFDYYNTFYHYGTPHFFEQIVAPGFVSRPTYPVAYSNGDNLLIVMVPHSAVASFVICNIYCK